MSDVEEKADLKAPATKPDSKSTNSSDSASTLDDYELVTGNSEVAEQQPNLKIPEDSDETDLQNKLKECIEDSPKNSSFLANENLESSAPEEKSLDFEDISYLGQMDIADPKNERLIHSQIKELNVLDDLSQQESRKVTVGVPVNADGNVAIFDSAKSILTLPVNRIIFFARGSTGTPEAACFAFTVAVPAPGQDDKPKVLFQSHVFRCQNEEDVANIFKAFAHAFKKPESDKVEPFYFEIALEIREVDPYNNQQFDLVPRQKSMFKLKRDVEKKVVLEVSQISKNSSCKLSVERCFGLLVSPGRNVRHADMQLLEHVTMATTVGNGDDREEGAVSHVITGSWDPREASFAMLNKETPHDVQAIYISIAADLVISQIAEPVRFVMETKARIYPKSERYWYYSRKALVRQYRVLLKKRPKAEDGKAYDLVGMDISEEMEQSKGKKSLGLQLASLTASTFGSIKTPPASLPSVDGAPSPTLTVEDDDSDNGEPLLSGFGEVSKECSENVLDMWNQVLQEWDKQPKFSVPKSLHHLVRTVGVPEALRGEVWQRMTGASFQQEEIVETYRILITKESPDDKVILRDIHRTFPAHDFFKDSGGAGQESLYRIAKAYSVYDSEIGYCQGQSFLIAALLLQMPEEQAFGVLVKVMHQLMLRDMFRENFEHLQMRLYQLDKLIESNFPDLWSHFNEFGIESHMYASQWFLTVFTAKFPLFLVFRVLDVFLLEGFESIFQVALALLKVAKRELLQQDFEGLMKYFRVNIPKTYRNEENARHLMQVASQIKLKKLKKYEKEWLAIKSAERAREDPVLRLEKDNKRLQHENLRLDTENDNLARELVNSKIEMRREIDAIEDARDHVEKELEGCKSLLSESADERKRLEGETEQLKQLLKREIDKFDAEIATKTNVISEYKTICSQLSEKLEKVQRSTQQLTQTNATGDGAKKLETEDSIDDRIKELELELAKTKLALVETECKNQDLTHQLMQESSVNVQGPTSAGGVSKNTWFSKTLSSIRESAAVASASASSGASMVRSMSVTGAAGKSLSKSSSIDNIRE